MESLATILFKHWNIAGTVLHSVTSILTHTTKDIVLEVLEHISVVGSLTHLCAQTPGTLPGPQWQRFQPIPHFKYHLVAQWHCGGISDLPSCFGHLKHCWYSFTWHHKQSNTSKYTQGHSSRGSDPLHCLKIIWWYKWHCGRVYNPSSCLDTWNTLDT